MAVTDTTDPSAAPERASSGGPRPRSDDEGAPLRHQRPAARRCRRTGLEHARRRPAAAACGHSSATCLTANSAWMSAFTAQNGLVIAPHGKTTMAPQLFDLQIADGAWAITVATVQQLEVCRRFGVHRVLMANQPIGRLPSMRAFAALRIRATVSSSTALPTALAGAALLAEGAVRKPPPDGSSAARSRRDRFPGRADGRAHPRRCACRRARGRGRPGLLSPGFECFEGLLPNVAAVDDFLDEVVAIAAIAESEELVPAGAPLILSAGGSAFFDRVGERFGGAAIRRPLLRVLRSGCYLTHDSVAYEAAFRRIVSDTALAPAAPVGSSLPLKCGPMSSPARSLAARSSPWASAT